MKIMVCSHNNNNSHLRQTSSINSTSNTCKASEADLLLNLASKHPQAKRRLKITTTLMVLEMALVASGYSSNNLHSRNKTCKGSRTRGNHNNNSNHSSRSTTISQNSPLISKTIRLLRVGMVAARKAMIPSNFSSSKQTTLVVAQEILLAITTTTLAIQAATYTQEFQMLVVVCLWVVQIMVGKVASNNNSSSRCIITVVTNRTNISLTISSNSNSSMVLLTHTEAIMVTTTENSILHITTSTSKISSSNTMVAVAVGTTATMRWVVVLSSRCWGTVVVATITVEISIMEVDSTTAITTIITTIGECLDNISTACPHLRAVATTR